MCAFYKLLVLLNEICQLCLIHISLLHINSNIMHFFVAPLPPDRIKVELGIDPTTTVRVEFYDPDVTLSKADKYFIILYNQTFSRERTKFREVPGHVVANTVNFVELLPGALYNVTFTSQVFDVKNSITVFKEINTGKC